jgi:hypothetical protein
MPTDTNVNSLVINKLTKAQYDAIQNPSETELYLVEEEIDTTPTSGSKNPITSGSVYTALQDKEDKVDIVSASGTTLTAEVGKYYTLSNVGTLAITLPTIAAGTTKVQTVIFYIAAGSSPAVTFTSTHPVYYSDGFEIAADSTYEVNALWNGTAWIVASVTIIVE